MYVNCSLNWVEEILMKNIDEKTKYLICSIFFFLSATVLSIAFLDPNPSVHNITILLMGGFVGIAAMYFLRFIELRQLQKENKEGSF